MLSGWLGMALAFSVTSVHACHALRKCASEHQTDLDKVRYNTTLLTSCSLFSMADCLAALLPGRPLGWCGFGVDPQNGQAPVQ
ncbi:hypothetical protein V8C86DRAFT_2696104, partial [Haematococcus lacustris]